MRTGLSSARHDGEPIWQGISPTTIPAIAAVPSATSDSVVAAVSSTHQQLSASLGHRCVLDAMAMLQYLAQCFKFGIFVGSTAHCSLKIPFRWSWSTVTLPFGGKVNRPIHANCTSAIVICLNQFYFEPNKFSRQLVTDQQLGEEQFHYFDAFPVSGSPHDSSPYSDENSRI